MAKKKKTSKGIVILIIIAILLAIAALILFPAETREFANTYLDIEIPELGDSSTSATPSPTSSSSSSESGGSSTPSEADPDGVLQVHFIDVGQGDGILIEFPDGQIMMIDAGNYYSSSTNEVLDYLEEQDIDVIDYFMLTHSDADHIGAVDEIVELYDVVNFYLPETTVVNHTTATYATALNAVAEEMEDGVTYSYYSMEGMVIEGEGWVIDFYMPIQDLYDSYPASAEWDSHQKNSVSPIIVLTYADRKIMFTGDSNEDNEEIFVYLYEGAEYLDVDVLKVAHHGSREGSTAEFLEIALPEYSVISCSADNTYGHPHEEAVDRLDNGTGVDGYDGGEVYVTAELGDILLTITADGDMNWEFQNS